METSSHSLTSEPVFHGDGLPEQEYRSVSTLAILSVLFGVASLLSFAGPLFLVIPLLGAALSIVALRQIAASEGAMVGRAAAICGLVMCVAFAAAAVARDLTIRELRTRQARELGQRWIGLLLAGQTEQAFRLTVDGTRPPPPPEPGALPAETSPFEDFVGHPVVKALSEEPFVQRNNGAAGAEIRFLETVEFRGYARRQFVVQQRFAVVPSEADPASPETLEVLLTLNRSQLHGEVEPRWLVSSSELPHATQWP